MIVKDSTQSPESINNARRHFLKTSFYSGALLMTVHLPMPALSKQGSQGTDDSQWCVYVTIRADNSVLMASPVVDMGQHMKTTGPMLLAEELDLDWSLIEFAKDCPTYFKVDNDGNVGYEFANMQTGGSHALRRNWAYMRQAGATVRRMLIEEAAHRWQVSPEEITTQNSAVIHNPTQKRFTYGELAEKAALRSVNPDHVKVKERSAFNIIGKPTKTVDIKDMVTGEPLYGIDTDYANQLHAVIARCPYKEGEIDTLDIKAAMLVPGVKKVVEIPVQIGNYSATEAKQLMAPGFAVIADNLWSAIKGKSKLNAVWKCSTQAGKQNSAAQLQDFKRIVMDPDYASSIGAEYDKRLQEGDAVAALADAETVLDNTYSVPLFAHTCMEPYNCIADVQKDSATVIVGHQFPDSVAKQTALLTGLDPLSVNVISKRIGGGFGRRWEVDFVREAVFLSHQLQKPVKVTWLREDEVEQDYFSPSMAMRVRAGMDREKKVVAWHHTQCQTRGGARYNCFPFKLVPHFLFDRYSYQSLIHTGPWRAPQHLHWAFAAESMIDELAYAANEDPLAFRLRLMEPHKSYDFADYGADKIDSGRMAACYKKAAEMANWQMPRPKGTGLGIAGHFTFGSYAAFVVEVEVSEQHQLNIKHAWGAIDCGLAVNPNHIENQMQGGFIDGLSTALFNKVDIVAGKVANNNFNHLRLMRMLESPQDIKVAIIKNEYPPTGVGEPPTPPAAAALANAVYAACGKRIRSLPMSESIHI